MKQFANHDVEAGACADAEEKPDSDAESSLSEFSEDEAAGMEL